MREPLFKPSTSNPVRSDDVSDRFRRMGAHYYHPILDENGLCALAVGFTAGEACRVSERMCELLNKGIEHEQGQRAGETEGKAGSGAA